eukprot:scaffold268258_cov22-Tisochrysis_lutea.AAC.2
MGPGCGRAGPAQHSHGAPARVAILATKPAQHSHGAPASATILTTKWVLLQSMASPASSQWPCSYHDSHLQ